MYESHRTALCTGTATHPAGLGRNQVTRDVGQTVSLRSLAHGNVNPENPAMARRRRRRTKLQDQTALMIGALLVLVGVAAVARYWPFVVGALIVVAAVFILRRMLQAGAQSKADRAAAERWEANLAAWRALTFEPGNFSVVVSGFRESGDDEMVAEFLSDIPVLRDQSFDEVEALIERAAHISPQTVAEGISQKNAIHLKEAIALRGAKVRIKEAPVRRASGGREPIPEKVRNEVWRRDGGQCVECGSREKLEYDHIVAVANGGSNTARNIELRCEPCNRKKGAKV